MYLTLTFPPSPRPFITYPPLAHPPPTPSHAQYSPSHLHPLPLRELVRKKAIMVMHHFLTLNPGLVSHLEDDFRRTLSDPDPGVMEASLILFHELVKVCMCACVCACDVCVCVWCVSGV